MKPLGCCHDMMSPLTELIPQMLFGAYGFSVFTMMGRSVIRRRMDPTSGERGQHTLSGQLIDICKPVLPNCRRLQDGRRRAFLLSVSIRVRLVLRQYLCSCAVS